MENKYTIGLDYGTNSVRAVLINVADGHQVSSSTYEYPSGVNGIILDEKEPLLARHNPRDYISGIEAVITSLLDKAGREYSILSDSVIGIGIDSTGSSPMPVDRTGCPLAFYERFKDEPNAYVWLWKDHSSIDEAQAITTLARKIRPSYLYKTGGNYSSEWFWSKILHCVHTTAEVSSSAWSWVEMCDWIPALLTGDTTPGKIKRGICSAGHKAMFHPDWDGWPDREFLSLLHPELARIGETLGRETFPIGEKAGHLCSDWADRLGLKTGIAVAVGGLDAHLGAVGAGIAPNILVRNIGTSACDMMISPLRSGLSDVAGLAGIIPNSILPGYYGLEAGQSAVGDIFKWYSSIISDKSSCSLNNSNSNMYEKLQTDASKIYPGVSGLLSLDWFNGNRTILMDQRLTGIVIGLTLHTSQAEIYRALIEGTAFGARTIVEHFEKSGFGIDRIINCGGIAYKSPLVMQIYADVLGRKMEVSESKETAALGSAISAAVAAGREAGGYSDFSSAIKAMTKVSGVSYSPDPEKTMIYNQLFSLFRNAHDSFGIKDNRLDMYALMKSLIYIKDEVSKSKKA